MNKICPRCKHSYPLEEFQANTRCQACNRLFTIEKQHNFKRACIKYKGGICQDCGDTPHLCFTIFSHRVKSTTNRTISKLVGGVPLTPDVQSELDKTDMLCANCWRVRFRKGSVSPAKLKAVQYKGSACENCGCNQPAALEFHHLDPGGKKYTIGNCSADGERMYDILAELDKCAMVCSNCHRLEHFLQKQTERNILREQLGLR